MTAPDPIAITADQLAAHGFIVEPAAPKLLHGRHGDYAPLPEGQLASLLIPLEDDWVSPTGDPTLREDVLSPLTQAREDVLESAGLAEIVVPAAASGWLPTLLRHVIGGGS
jgi:hypothetical protein